jgi:triosephosphate isomerase
VAQKTYLFVANWKMNVPFDAAQFFFGLHSAQLQQIACSTGNTLIVCPSFVSLSEAVAAVRGTQIHIGAQNCSEHVSGAYTGEVDAVSLAQMGTEYCIVGHSERRQYYGETNEMVAGKVAQLMAVGITPIMCIGQTREQYKNNETKSALMNQLMPIFCVLRTAQSAVIAYEPVWAIGTGELPDVQHIAGITEWVRELCAAELPHAKVQVLYGGSVSESNAQDIMKDARVDGVLMGGVSLDFQKFKNIVSLKR